MNMPLYHNKKKKRNEEEISHEILKYLETKDNYSYQVEPDINNRKADFLITHETGNIAIEIKSFAPTKSAVSQVSGLADESAEKYNRETIAIIVFPKHNVPKDVQQYADEMNVKLYPVRDMKYFKKKLDKDFNL